MVVSDPAVTEDPAARRLASITVPPASPETGITAASAVRVNPGEAAAGSGVPDFFPAATSSGGLSRTIKRFPAPSHEWPYGARRSSTIRVTGGLFLYWFTRIARILSF